MRMAKETKRPSKPFTIAIVVTLLGIGAFGWRAGPKAPLQRSLPSDAQVAVDLRSLSMASENFLEMFNRWPTNLTELSTNPRGLALYTGPFSDPWGRPYSYVVPVRGVGTIATFGADGNPDGNKLDGDVSITLKEHLSPGRRELTLKWRQPPPR
jgi:hypothetical protein